MTAAEIAPSLATTPMPGALQVRVNALGKRFRRRKDVVQVLQDVSIDIAKGEFLVLLGPSGCGKTTLLRCLVGLEQPDEGTIELRGERVVDADRNRYTPPNRRDVAMVFQDYALWPHMTVSKNVAYPLKARRMRDALKSGRVAEALRVVQCEDLADRYPPELSGGQQQRVSLARALASHPSLLLLDEPLSNLDVLLRVELRAQLRLLHMELGFTAVHVTHDQEEALALGTRVAVMNKGRIEQVGPPQEVWSAPATEYVADFLGARNRLTASIDDSGRGEILGQPFATIFERRSAGEFVGRARDHHLTIRSREGSEREGEVAWLSGARLVEILPGGESSECVVDVAGRRLFVKTPNSDITFRAGDTVDVGVHLDEVFWYENDRLIPSRDVRGRTS
ncbi:MULTISPECIES: ABC transporter ATP-binding protein [unclassified Microbacterium]|uniref:ABC transporter ATP-binding protein n=1 Tax=unclassified Microbacterium TaxID=2609290 RepID=UPI00214B062F|nr:MULTISPECIES: ABC transporter ATP-binding protein [unclassified Microbacterium]MCR2811313.1 ABC transporter ATP-binding protein [Microbacterium sp. zg.B185]WIM19470.1 ABC transporter ATP-binding protein [Microbacterium sp. zg-B185]